MRRRIVNTLIALGQIEMKPRPNRMLLVKSVPTAVAKSQRLFPTGRLGAGAACTYQAKEYWRRLLKRAGSFVSLFVSAQSELLFL